MKKGLLRVAAVTASLAIATVASAAPAPAPASGLLPARVARAAKARVKAGEFPALVIAVVDGKRSRVYGFGKLADGQAPGANTVFEVGSVTKTFTATLLAEAVARDRLRLDEPVAKLLPAFTLPSRDGKAITLGELADQHSGLPRLPGNLNVGVHPHNPYVAYDGEKLKAFLAHYRLPRDPGSAYEYSNLGFGLLGYALARHAGTSYGALLEKRVLEPLHMSESGVTITAAMRKHLALGHDRAGKPVENWDLNALAGAGALKSTAADMLRYLEANMGVWNTPLDAAMKLAHEPRADGSGPEKVGLAWMTRSGKHGDIVWHNGMTGGYASFIGFTADGKRGVVVLTNIQQEVDDLGFATLLPGTKLAPAEAVVHLPGNVLAQYAGYYRLAPHFVLHVFRQDGQMYAQATGQGAFPIFPSTKDEFFARMADIRLSFERGGNGHVTGLVLHQHGDHPAPRVATAAAAAAEKPPKAVSLPAKALKQYVGRYRLASGAVFDITVEGGQLYAQLTGQARLPVYASAKDEFFYRAVNARISFERGPQGKVDALVLHQNGADRRASRLPAGTSGTPGS